MNTRPDGEAADPARTVRSRPTGALVRAAAVGVSALVLAVLVGKPPLILVGLPLLVWAVAALARRTARGEERGVPLPRLRLNRQQIGRASCRERV